MSQIGHLIVALLLSIGVMHSAFAQSYPVKPVRVIVALAPGGGVDTTARIVAQRLTQVWGQQVLIENRPGAGGTIAAEAVARATPDGYTLLMNSSSHAITPALYKLAYDAVTDFSPISVVVDAPNVLVVHPSVPARSVKELIALAKARPDELLYSSSGNGSPTHLTLELLKLMTGIRMVHVPYKGTAPSIIDLVAGRVSATASSVTSTMPHTNAGRLRALAVASGRRSLSVPQLPTIAEAGVRGFANDVWYSLMAPAATPRNIVVQIHGEIARAIAQPDVKERLLGAGLEPIGSSPDDASAYLRSEVAKWSKVIRQAGVRAE